MRCPRCNNPMFRDEEGDAVCICGGRVIDPVLLAHALAADAWADSGNGRRREERVRRYAMPRRVP